MFLHGNKVCQGNIKKGSKGRFSGNHYKAMDC